MVKKIFQWFVYTIFSLLIVFSMYSFINVEILKKDYTNIFGYTYFIISTGSMEPEISINDIVIIKLDDGYKSGDIVTYKLDNSFITHRVVSINDKDLILKGDANNTPDDVVRTDAVIGKVKYHFSSGIILKLFGVVLGLFILISFINFEKIFKKYVLRENNSNIEAILEELMKVRNMPRSDNTTNITKKQRIKFYSDTLNILSADTESIEVLGHDNREKIKYIYRLCLLLKQKDYLELEYSINNPTFEELFDYDFNKINFSNNYKNQLYVMPISAYLKILLTATLYDKDKFFDATYKVMKYKICVDKNKTFIKKPNMIEIDKLMHAIEEISKEISLNLEREVAYISAKKNLEK